MKKVKVGFIGCGARSAGAYARQYDELDNVEIAALADPAAGNRKALIDRLCGGEAPAQYDHWRDMLAEHTLDGVVIATPNHVHADPAVDCLEAGIPVALEKPLASTKVDCERIISAEKANNGRTLIGFVLRSAPFYTIAHRLIAEGAIGQIVSLQADELVGYNVSSIMSRSPWRRLSRFSGGAFLEKCCHDIDLINWVMGCRPVSISSYGGSMIFNPNPSLPDRCDDCGQAKTCRYYGAPAVEKADERDEALMHRYVRSESDRCIYNIDKDGVDNQSAAIEYENGSIANLMMTFNAAGPRSGRNLHAVGLKGRVWGNLADKVVYHYDNQTDKVTEHDASGDGTGHGGGDRIHALQLVKMMEDPKYRPAQDASAGYLSAVMCFASDLSRVERRRIDLTYGEDGFIDFA